MKQGKYKAAEAMFKKVLKTVHTEDGDSGEKPNHRERSTSSTSEGVMSDRRRSMSPQVGDTAYWHKLSPMERYKKIY